MNDQGNDEVARVKAETAGIAWKSGKRTKENQASELTVCKSLREELGQMDEETEHQLFAEWSVSHRSRAVFVDADFAPADEAVEWVEDLLQAAVAAMADAGVGPISATAHIQESKLYVSVNGLDSLARDTTGEGAERAVTRVFGLLDQVAIGKGRRERWYVWYEGDPAGMAYFLGPDEFATSRGDDVRGLETGGYWFPVTTDDGQGEYDTERMS